MSKIVVENARVTKAKSLGAGHYSLTLAPFSKVKSIRPGQFVHLKIPGCAVYFRRAFSVYDIDTKTKSFEVIFKVMGRGTSFMASLKKGDTMDVLGPLGNGFSMPKRSEKAILIAGGVGMPPIQFLANHLVNKNFKADNIVFFYGGRTRSDLVELTRLKKLGIKLILATEDGSAGFRGLVTVAVSEWVAENNGKKAIYACGPEGMLQAVNNLAGRLSIPGQLSLEAPMPCGIGICLGCIRPLRAGGYTRVCREGPVYNIGEVLL